MKKMSYVIIGFIAGILYIASCGGSTVSGSLADTIGNAIDVVYDNLSSSLSSTNVQDAIDELKTSVDALAPTDLATTIIGTWSSECYEYQGGGTRGNPTTATTNVIFSSDGSLSLDSTWGITNAGQEPSSYEVINNNLVLLWSNTTYFPILVVNTGANQLTFEDSLHVTICVLTK